MDWRGRKTKEVLSKLESRNNISKQVSEVEKENRSIIHEQSDVVNEIKLFYEKLYTKKTPRSYCFRKFQYKTKSILCNET